MKFSKLLIISLLLVTAILAPSVIALVNSGEKTAVVIDFNEEEKKEEKKEVNEKDFLFSFDLIILTSLNGNSSKLNSFYFEKSSSYSRTIFLPPPENIV